MICDYQLDNLILLKDASFADFKSAPTFNERMASEYADDVDFLTALALQNEKVVAVRAFETDEARVFAVLTTPVYLKSERDELAETLSSTLKQSKDTYISFDNDVFRKIKDDMTDAEKERLLDIVVKRENERRR